MDDEDAIAAVLAGDVESFRLLVVRYQRALFALVRSFVRDEGQAEDLVQESFLRAFEALGAFDPARGRFKAWLYQLTRNRCRDALRRTRARPVQIPDVPPELPAADSAAHDRAVGAQLGAALAGLAPERRVAFLLVEVHGLTVAEAAEIEDVAVGTIKSRASRARAELRAALAPEGRDA